MPSLRAAFSRKMAVDDLAVAADQARDLETELPDGRAHAIHRGVVLARIAWILDEPFDRPQLDALYHGLRCHAPEYQFSVSVVNSKREEATPLRVGACSLRPHVHDLSGFYKSRDALENRKLQEPQSPKAR